MTNTKLIYLRRNVFVFMLLYVSSQFDKKLNTMTEVVQSSISYKDWVTKTGLRFTRTIMCKNVMNMSDVNSKEAKHV
jgi:hypothetical protein